MSLFKGDSLGSQVGQQFSTYDSDNDKYHVNCAERYKGAWWFATCGNCHLNAKYIDLVGGIDWYDWKKNVDNLKETQMKINPFI